MGAPAAAKQSSSRATQEKKWWLGRCGRAAGVELVPLRIQNKEKRRLRQTQGKRAQERLGLVWRYGRKAGAALVPLRIRNKEKMVVKRNTRETGTGEVGVGMEVLLRSRRSARRTADTK